MPNTAKRSSQLSDLLAFSERLNEALDDKGLPPRNHGRQVHAAELFGKSQKAVRRWLVGEGWPEKAEWENIATICNVRPEWLFFNLGPKREGRQAQVGTDGYNRKLLEAVINCVDEACDKSTIKADKNARTELALSIYERLATL